MREGGGRFPEEEACSAFTSTANLLACWPNSLADNEFWVVR